MIANNKNVVFNLLFLNEIKQHTELLTCLIARSIPTSIDIIIGLPTIRAHDLVLKIPSHFTSNETNDRFAEIFPCTSCTPAGTNLFGIGRRGFETLPTHPPRVIKLTRNFTPCRNLTLKFFQNVGGKAASMTRILHEKGLRLQTNLLCGSGS